LHIATRLGRANFSASNWWINRFKRRHKIVYWTIPGESRSADSESARMEKFLTIARNEGCDLCDIHNDEIHLFFNLQPSKTFTF
jgi:hypothetical protein